MRGSKGMVMISWMMSKKYAYATVIPGSLRKPPDPKDVALGLVWFFHNKSMMTTL